VTTTQTETTVYGRSEFRDADIGAQMRHGHPDIAEGDSLIVSLVEERARELGRPLRIIDVGSGSGVLSEMLAERLRDSRVVANDNEPALVEQAIARLEDKPNAEVFGRSFVEWDEPVDVVISWGTHHHMPHSYLDQSRRLLGPNGLFIIGDEFCPEYCTPADAERIAGAAALEICDGFVLTGEDHIAAFKRDGTIPDSSRDLEQRRRLALWEWYKYVVDFAVARRDWVVVMAEIQICLDDLTTDFEEEHKLSPLIVERELQLNGFRLLSKHVIGEGERPKALQSFFIYAYAPGDPAGAPARRPAPERGGGRT
jgi:cyclopropane fatty-acyl-phospholipid synthase-like methyltransferase